MGIECPANAKSNNDGANFSETISVGTNPVPTVSV